MVSVSLFLSTFFERFSLSEKLSALEQAVNVTAIKPAQSRADIVLFLYLNGPFVNLH